MYKQQILEINFNVRWLTLISTLWVGGWWSSSGDIGTLWIEFKTLSQYKKGFLYGPTVLNSVHFKLALSNQVLHK